MGWVDKKPQKPAFRKFSSEISKMLESFSLNSLRSEVRSVKQALEIEEFHVH